MPYSALATFNYGFRRRGRLLVENLEDQDGVRIDPVEDSPRVVSVANPKLVAMGADRGHGARLREPDSVALLKSPQEISGFDSRIGREWRSLDFAL
jgi:hypothetical protein